MIIHHQISKLYKIINLDGQVIEQAEVRVDKKLSYSLNKGSGFYVLYDLLEGKHTLTISHPKYKTLEFIIDIVNTQEVQPEILYLEWKASYIPNGKKVVVGTLDIKQSNFDYYYCVCTKKNTFKVFNDVSKGSELLKIKFSESILLDYREIAISGYIHKLKEYDFEKKGYLLNSPLEEEMELGDIVYLLNKGVTDTQGNYEILVDTNLCDKENKITVLFFYEGQQQKVVVQM